MLKWLKLTGIYSGDNPVWVNLDLCVEIQRSADNDRTFIYTGHMSGSSATYYSIEVLETPEQIMKQLLS